MFRLFYLFLFAWLFLFGCAGDEPDPVSIVSVSPPEGSTLEPQDSIVIEFTEIPEYLFVYAGYRDISDQLSLDGRIATVPAPFIGSDGEEIEIEFELLWGRPDQESTHRLNYFVGPHWADGIIEIEVGRFQTGKEMLAVLNSRRIGTSESILTMLSKPNFPMSRQRKTISVAVLTLQEAGFTEPATVPEIRRRFKQLGYRPLTLEEVIETRLQFRDQPDRPAEYWFPQNTTPPPPEYDRSPKNRMDAFYALPERNDILNEAGSASNVLFKIVRNSYYARIVGTREISIGAKPVEKLDPLAPAYDVTRGALGGFTGARIACAITEE